MTKSFALVASTDSVPLKQSTEIFVSPQGNDAYLGTQSQPVATWGRAQILARAARKKGKAVTVNFRAGTYYLPTTQVFSSEDSGTATSPMVYRAYGKEQVVISGGQRLVLQWHPYKAGIWQAHIPDNLQTDQLFVNGEHQQMARYPNFDSNAHYLGGTASDAISKERASHWSDPAGGYFHALHKSLWGGYSWRILGKDAGGDVQLEGGWQNNRGGQPHEEYRYVENIFEELDAPGEWFLDSKTHTLFFYPPKTVDLSKARVEAVRLRHLIEFRGTANSPVQFVTLKGLTFRHTARTFMENKEPLLRSDWTTYRGGSIFFNGARNCELQNCVLDQLGGNAVFVNNYNRRITIRGCLIEKAGANGVAFVGDPKAVRSPLFGYEQKQEMAAIDRTPGPRSDNYPADCLVEDCLVTQTGLVEKQTAGVTIDMAQGITVRHCSIYDMPRAGINIGDGAWGGHLIEGCDVFDTVKETGDHGSFNSWGRDRFWRPSIEEVNEWVKKVPSLPLLDALNPTVLRHNRWRCDHGWDIDLDDGSSNYVIQNNLCLNNGIKNREGFGRVVENNILVNNSFHPHVWYQNSGDVFRHNIVGTPYSPVGMPTDPWGKEVDFNFLQLPGGSTSPATELQGQSRRDAHSLQGDALFMDAANGDYRVRQGSPALTLGFKNFSMTDFGVQSPKLKALARTPQWGRIASPNETPTRDTRVYNWNGARIRNIANAGEMSAYGVSGVTGVLVLNVPPTTELARAGLKKNDVILGFGGQRIGDIVGLQKQTSLAKAGQMSTITISRTQKEMILSLRIDPAMGSTLVPLPQQETVRQEATGSIRLSAINAVIVGTTARKERSGGGNIGYWKDGSEFVLWPVHMDKTGMFNVQINYACQPGSEGSGFALATGNQTLTGVVKSTRSWQDYQTFDLGVLRVDEPGTVLFTLKPTKKLGDGIMNLRLVELTQLN